MIWSTDISIGDTDVSLPFCPKWQPKADISTHELALCLPILIGGASYPAWWTRQTFEALPAAAQRHFVVTGQPASPHDDAAQAASIWDSLKSVASA